MELVVLLVVSSMLKPISLEKLEGFNNCILSDDIMFASMEDNVSFWIYAKSHSVFVFFFQLVFRTFRIYEVGG